MRSTFCCFFSIRTGASVIGWFNFLFNSIYVGMVVFALARIKNQIHTKKMSFQNKDVPFSSVPSNASNSVEIRTFETIKFEDFKCTFQVDERVDNSCTCDNLLELLTNSSITCFDKTVNKQKCFCELDYVSKVPIPYLYWSLSIPAIIIISSTMWLSVAESGNYYYMRCIGFFFCVFIPFQLMAELSFLLFLNISATSISLLPLHPIVWIVYSVYAILNIYFVPIIWDYIKLRSKEFHSGLEQGLLTAQRFPLTMQKLDHLVDDAFEYRGIDDEL